jgi:hypothetical protein
MKETLLQRCQRLAREKYAQDSGEKAHNLLSAEELDELIANTLKQAAEEVGSIIEKSNEDFENEPLHPVAPFNTGYNTALTEAQKVLIGELDI